MSSGSAELVQTAARAICTGRQRNKYAAERFQNLRRIMAKPWTWVGLDTNATAGRNDSEVFVTHDSVGDIVTSCCREANCGSEQGVTGGDGFVA